MAGAVDDSTVNIVEVIIIIIIIITTNYLTGLEHTPDRKVSITVSNRPNCSSPSKYKCGQQSQTVDRRQSKVKFSTFSEFRHQ